ncbi:MAG: hypothetical protein EOP89_14850 [Lysobacteraceae bacterium]|nr:MAG: hypothetical protein EOP89_14850 [Xanthomonadaceae bacterium]
MIDGFVERTGLTVQLSAFGPMGPTIVQLYSGRPALLTTLHVGPILPLAASATGRVFLAFMPGSETADLLKAERNDASADRPSLNQICATIRTEGKALETGTVIPVSTPPRFRSSICKDARRWSRPRLYPKPLTMGRVRTPWRSWAHCADTSAPRSVGWYEAIGELRGNKVDECLILGRLTAGRPGDVKGAMVVHMSLENRD